MISHEYLPTRLFPWWLDVVMFLASATAVVGAWGAGWNLTQAFVAGWAAGTTIVAGRAIALLVIDEDAGSA